MTWLRAHWLAVVLGLAVGGAGAWLLKPNPQPAVTLKQDTAAHKDTATDTAKREQKGAEDVVRRTYRPPPASCPPGTPPVLASETTIHRGPSSADTNTKKRSEEQLEQHLSLAVTPAPPPRWALGAGLEDLLGSRRLQVTAGMRLLGPVWLRAGVAPARGLGSATVGLEVTW